MYSLNSKTKKSIEDSFSMPLEKIIELDHEEGTRLIESVTSKKLVFSNKRDSRKVGRGSPYLSRKRLRTIEEVDRKLAEICNAGV